MVKSCVVQNGRVEAEIVSGGGCIRQASLDLGNGRKVPFWAFRGEPNDERFWMNGVWIGDWGRTTDTDGCGGIMPIPLSGGGLEKFRLPFTETDKPKSHPNQNIHSQRARNPWEVTPVSNDSVEAVFTTEQTRGHGDLVQNGLCPRHQRLVCRYTAGGPFPLVSVLGSFSCNAELTNTDSRLQQGGVCWHAQWPLTMSPDKTQRELELLLAPKWVHPKQNDILLPLGSPNPVSDVLDASKVWRPVSGDFDNLDHCFSGLSTPELLNQAPYAFIPQTLSTAEFPKGELFNAVALRWPVTGVLAVITMSTNIRCVVVYTPTETDGPFFGHACIEFQTAWSNAPACAANGCEDTGLVDLQHGESMKTFWQVSFYKIAT